MTSSDPTPSRRSRRLWLAAGLAGAVAVALVSAAITLAPAPSVAAGFWRHDARGPHGFFGGHRRGFGHRAFDRDRLEFGVSWVLRDVDASDAQIDRVTAVLEAAAGDLQALHPEGHEGFAALEVALSGESVDRDALESLRGEKLVLADKASARLVAALADAADVLTPEQRQSLIEQHRDHRGRH